MAGWLLLSVRAFALGPHQIALIINQNSEHSLTLGNHYASAYSIPVQNRIYVSLPDSVREAASALPEKTFTEIVIEPVQAALSERGLSEHILAWVYSADFPVLILGPARTSLTGCTYFAGRLPPPSDIHSGKTVTPLFGGIKDDARPGYPFLAYRNTLKEKMPVPSMMLAHLGARGLTLEEAVAMIDRSRRTEGTLPKGTVYFEQGKDVRAKTREFQFEDTVKKLAGGRVKAAVIPGLPGGKKDVLGVLAGRTFVPPRGSGVIRPGAYCDHLTSFAADFDMYHHTKCSEWLRYGASGTSGPVVEPLAIWTKFPSARFFEFYTSGFTMIESLYLSTASPYQTLMMGDPLCAPFNQRIALTLLPISGKPLKGAATLQGHPLSPIDSKKLFWRLSINGVPQGALSRNPVFEIDTTRLADGAHAFGVEAFAADQPLIMGFAEEYIDVSNLGRGISLELNGKHLDASHPITATIHGAEQGTVLGLEVNGRLQKPEGEVVDGTFHVNLPPRAWGEGDAQLRGVAEFEDGMVVRSSPVEVKLENLNKAPEVSVRKTKGENKSVLLSPTVSDPEGDETQILWSAQLLEGEFSPTQAVKLAESVLRLRPNGEKMVSTGFLPEPLGAMNHIRVKMSPLKAGIGIAGGYRFGVVFGDTGPGTFSFFGYGGMNGSWILADVDQGSWKILQSRGRPVFVGRDYLLDLEVTDAGMLRASVNGERVFEQADFKENDVGRCGVYAERFATASEIWIPAEALEGVSVDKNLNTLMLQKKSDRSEYQTLAVRVRDDLGMETVKKIK